MTPEEKELLLKDLSARLPYDLQVKTGEDDEPYTLLSAHPNKGIALIGIDMGGVYATSKVKIDTIKSYLRPMSSMTEEEKEELDELGLAYWDNGKYTDEDGNTIIYGGKGIQLLPDIETYDWLNEHHFDYRDLIGKGLALEAPKDMYK